MNNSIKDHRGKVLGFRCFQCGNIFESMWGTTCNGCRKSNEKHNQLINEIMLLRKQLAEKGGEG